MVIRQPVDEAFVLDQAVELRLPVVAEVAAGDVHARRPSDQDADLVAARGQITDRHVLAPIHQDGDTGERIGVGRGVGTAQRGSGEINRDVRGSDDDRRVRQVGGAQPMVAGGDGDVAVEDDAGGRRQPGLPGRGMLRERGRHDRTQRQAEREERQIPPPHEFLYYSALSP